jgi:pimeloyl-ACP methyl ester carboxylesterase
VKVVFFLISILQAIVFVAANGHIARIGFFFYKSFSIFESLIIKTMSTNIKLMKAKIVILVCVTLLALLAMTTLSVVGQVKNAKTISKKTFILIHGSWHNAWNWHKVTPLLEKEGHTVYAIDLPGMVRDKTPIENVKFDSTIQILCRLIDSIPGKVILVAHSKNGIMNSQLAELRSEKIEKLIYIAAVLVANGKCASDYFAQDQEEVLGPHITFDIKTQSSMLLPEIYKEGLYHDCDDDITEMAKVLLSNEPKESAKAVLKLTEEKYGRVPRYYIECTEDRAITPWLQEKMLQQMSCRKVYKLQSSHSPFFSMPDKLTDIICEIAKL